MRPFAVRLLLVLAACASLTLPASARTVVPGATFEAESVAADTADVQSLDALLTALYATVSGAAGERRDWDRFRALFTEGARLVPLDFDDDSLRVPFPLGPSAFAERAALYFKDNGFFEHEIGRQVESFGAIIHVFSAYEVRYTQDDEEPFVRGVNSIQVLHDGASYRILSMTWDEETETNPIPESLLRDW